MAALLRDGDAMALLTAPKPAGPGLTPIEVKLLQYAVVTPSDCSKESVAIIADLTNAVRGMPSYMALNPEIKEALQTTMMRLLNGVSQATAVPHAPVTHAPVTTVTACTYNAPTAEPVEVAGTTQAALKKEMFMDSSSLPSSLPSTIPSSLPSTLPSTLPSSLAPSLELTAKECHGPTSAKIGSQVAAYLRKGFTDLAIDMCRRHVVFKSDDLVFAAAHSTGGSYKFAQALSLLDNGQRIEF